MTHYICKFGDCGKAFTSSTGLIVHHMRHKDIRPYKCNMCESSFTQSGTLKRHKRGVHGTE